MRSKLRPGEVVRRPAVAVSESRYRYVVKNRHSVSSRSLVQRSFAGDSAAAG